MIDIKQFNTLIVNIIKKIQFNNHNKHHYLVYQSNLFQDKSILNEVFTFINSDAIKNNFIIKKINKNQIFISWKYNFFKVQKINFNIHDNHLVITTVIYNLPLIENNYLIKLHTKLTIEEYYKKKKMITPISINNYLKQNNLSISEFSKKINLKEERIIEILNYSLMSNFENNKIKKGIYKCK